jgi:hypothetical protein
VNWWNLPAHLVHNTRKSGDHRNAPSLLSLHHQEADRPILKHRPRPHPFQDAGPSGNHSSIEETWSGPTLDAVHEQTGTAQLNTSAFTASLHPSGL